MRSLILILVFFLTACSSALPSFKTYKVDIQQGNVVTPKMMMQLKPGMNKSQVRFILGTPLLQDTFHRDRWDYFYELNKGGKVIERRRVILDFENEALKSVRGDIIPAGQPGAENAPIASVQEIVTAKSNKDLMLEESQKPWWERFKFWGDDDNSVDAAKSTTTANQNRVVIPAPDAKPAVAAATVGKQAVSTAAKAVDTTATAATAKVAGASANKVDPEIQQMELIRKQLNQWVAAWQARKLNDYLNIYSANFQPEGVGRKSWLLAQQEKFGSAEYIEDIQLQFVQIDVHGSLATVSFEQISTKPTGVTKSAKEMDFENEGGLWRIIRERVKTEFAPETVQQTPLKSSTDGVILHERSERPPEYPNAKPEPIPEQQPAGAESKVETKASKPAERNQLPELNNKKDEPLPAEDEPGYFDKLLKRIGF